MEKILIVGFLFGSLMSVLSQESVVKTCESVYEDYLAEKEKVIEVEKFLHDKEKKIKEVLFSFDKDHEKGKKIVFEEIVEKMRKLNLVNKRNSKVNYKNHKTIIESGAIKSMISGTRSWIRDIKVEFFVSGKKEYETTGKAKFCYGIDKHDLYKKMGLKEIGHHPLSSVRGHYGEYDRRRYINRQVCVIFSTVKNVGIDQTSIREYPTRNYSFEDYLRTQGLGQDVTNNCLKYEKKRLGSSQDNSPSGNYYLILDK